LACDNGEHHEKVRVITVAHHHPMFRPAAPYFMLKLVEL